MLNTVAPFTQPVKYGTVVMKTSYSAYSSSTWTYSVFFNIF